MARGLRSTLQFDLLFSNLSARSQRDVEGLVLDLARDEARLEPVFLFDENLGRDYRCIRRGSILVTYLEDAEGFLLLTCFRRDR